MPIFSKFLPSASYHSSPKREGCSLTMAAETDSESITSRDDADERSPLLKKSIETSNRKRRPQAKDVRFRVLALLYTAIIALNAALILQDAPATRLFEIVYCRAFYEEHDPSLIGDNGVVDEKYCKNDFVQSQVAFLKGWLSFFRYLPGKIYQWRCIPIKIANLL